MNAIELYNENFNESKKYMFYFFAMHSSSIVNTEVNISVVFFNAFIIYFFI